MLSSPTGDTAENLIPAGNCFGIVFLAHHRHRSSCLLYVLDRRLKTTNDGWSWKVTRVLTIDVFVIYREGKVDF